MYRNLNHNHRRRGTVLIMVIGVLAMLFIIGSSLLIVARFERNTADLAAVGRSLDAVGIAILDPIIAMLGTDVKGDDGVPYNRGFVTGDTSIAEDYTDLPGFISQVGNNVYRNGDLYLSSNEPIRSGANRPWVLTFASAGMDALTPNQAYQLSSNSPESQSAQRISRSNGPGRDADGDGLTDSGDSGIFANLTATFGGGYRLEARVLGNGGMIELNRLTHPALLATAIHPLDYADPFAFLNDNPDLSNRSDLEGALRRRYMLPRQTPDTDPNSIDKLLPYTLGFQPTPPHWWPVDGAVSGDDAWWQSKFTPGAGRQEGAYAANSDTYDRRHILSMEVSDDLLRPIRGEDRLQNFVITAPVTYSGVRLYNLIHPTAGGVPDARFYGVIPFTNNVAFNSTGLSTQFSLRDVLVDPATNGNAEASLRRAMQLTAYYLAMIQYTSVPGSSKGVTDPTLTANELFEQLREAMQLAVNTIDFADSDQVPSRLTLGVTHLKGSDTITVIGFEKQPFITEVYAKAAVEYVDVGLGVVDINPDSDSAKAASILAVELYNPYTVALDLTGFDLVVTSTADNEYTVPLGTLNGGSLAAGARIVVASRSADQHGAAPASLPFDGTTADPRVVTSAQTALWDAMFDPRAPDAPKVIALKRKTVLDLGTAGAGPVDIAVDRIDVTATTATINYDLTTDALSHWAIAPEKTDIEAIGGVAPPAAGFYWRHTSIQRHKEPDPDRALYWHVTINRQLAFESVIRSTVAAFPQIGLALCHDLLDYGRASDEASGLPLPVRHIAENNAYVQGIVNGLGSQPGANRYMGVADLMPVPLLTSDAGAAVTPVGPATDVATRAFPTTGSLLLVSRYGHGQLYNRTSGNFDLTPVTAAVVTPELQGFNGTTPQYLNPMDASGVAFGQLGTLHNGHMPIFRGTGNSGLTQDRSRGDGRMALPWGQMVFHYFTALPLEELVVVGDDASLYTPVAGAPFAGYPYHEPVNAAPSAYGLKVHGRPNISMGPWRVLDGLPMLPDSGPEPVGTNTVYPYNNGPLTGLPVAELLGSRLDPNDATFTANHTPFGQALQNLLIDPVDANHRAPTVSATLARYMVSSRERREVDGLRVFVDNDTTTWSPGFNTIGELCDLVFSFAEVSPLKTLKNGDVENTLIATLNNPVDSPNALSVVRNYYYSDADGKTRYPFAYLGFLQAVAPVVRLQDWATVKSHVYTVYSNISTDTEPRIQLRSQVTVDRTRCLYSNDLPERITELAPTSYYNAIED